MIDDGLDPSLAALLAHESDAPAVDPARLAKARARLEAAMVAPPPYAPPKRTSGATATRELLRLAGALAVGVVLGAAGSALLGPKPTQPRAEGERGELGVPVVATAPSPEPAAPANGPGAAPLAAAPGVPPPRLADQPRAASPASPPLAAPSSTHLGAEAPPTPPPPPAQSASASLSAPTRPATLLDEERGLVEQGRVALARRDWLSSLEAMRAHRQRFPKGQLAEERDALEVQALAAGGHSADARRKGEAFLTAYPQSMLRGRIDAVLRELPR